MRKMLVLISLLSCWTTQQLTAQLGGHYTVVYGPKEKPVHFVPAVIVRRTMDSTLSYPAYFPSPYKSDYRFNRDPQRDPQAELRFGIRVGTFAIRGNAYRLKRRLEHDGYMVRVYEWTSNKDNRIYNVVSVFGHYLTRDEAMQGLDDIGKTYRLRDMLLATRQVSR